MKKIVKEIELNEAVMTLYNSVKSIYSSMYNEIPDNIKEETKKYLHILGVEKEKKYPPKLDIKDNKIIDKITFYKNE